MSTRSSACRRWAAVALVAVLATGCGTRSGEQEQADQQPSSSPSSSSAAAGEACSEVWVEGEDLPARYDGCDDGGSFVSRDVLSCSSGQRMVRFDDHYYAVLGGTIHETESVLDEDVGYRDAVASCRG